MGEAYAVAAALRLEDWALAFVGLIALLSVFGVVWLFVKDLPDE